MTAEILPMHNNQLLSAALAYASIGWHILPAWWVVEQDGVRSCACGNAGCKSPGKHPIGKVAPWGQNSATTDAEKIKTWWEQYPSANIAAYLEPSKLAAIDIDPRNMGLDTIDQIEAKHGKLESDLLQFTGGGGEHRVFQVPSGNVALPGKLGPGVDVKLNGYIMLEPSNHMSGGVYAWEASSDPRDGILASPMPDWLRDLAYQRVAAPPVPDSAIGQRVMVISATQRDELQQALRVIPSDDRDTWLQVGMALKSTHDHQWAYDTWRTWSEKSSKFDPVDQLRVWRSIKPMGLDGVTYKTIFALSKKHGQVVRTIPSAELVEAEVVKPTEYVDPLPFPGHLLQAPGVMGDFLRWMVDCAQKPQPVLALAAVINLLATALAQKVQTNTGLRTNFYTVGVGATSAGKDHARKCNKVAMNAAGIGNLIGGEELASAQGLLARAAKEPKTLFQIDEFGLFLQAITSHGAGSHLKQIMTVLMKLFTSAGSVYHGTEYADQAARQRVDIEYPCINMHATTTPETLFEAFTGADLTSGSLNRMLFFFAPEREGNWPMRFVSISQPPEPLTAWLKAAWMMPGAFDPATPVTVPMSPEALQQFELLYDYQQDCERKAKPNGTDGLYGRLWEHAAKLALIAACARHADAGTFTKVAESNQLVISGADASWAIELVCYLIKRMDFEVTGRVADSEFGRDKQSIMGCIERAGKFGLTERELARVSRKFGGMNPMQRQAVMAALMAEEAVARVDFAPPSGRGRHRVAMVSTTFYSLENHAE